MGCQQCLPLSVVELKGKHCWIPHYRNGVADTFELCTFHCLFWYPQNGLWFENQSVQNTKKPSIFIREAKNIAKRRKKSEFVKTRFAKPSLSSWVEILTLKKLLVFQQIFVKSIWSFRKPTWFFVSNLFTFLRIIWTKFARHQTYGRARTLQS